MDIAVIGSGVAGLGAAWALDAAHRVTVYEADDRLGGHANTVEIADGARRIAVDTGFIVCNERNYPNLVRLFERLGVETEPSDMSFSVSKEAGTFEYQARALGLLAQPSNMARRDYLRMIADIQRFTRRAPGVAVEREGETTGELLDRMGLSPAFRRDFLLPVIACIWSSNLEEMLAFPARSMISFLDNHGLLNLLRRPRWRTVTGGSREYVRSSLRAPRASGAASDRRDRDRARRRRRERVSTRPAVSIASTRWCSPPTRTHRCASSVPTPTPREREALSAFRYQENRAVLHRDPSFMPNRRRLWSSWNYLLGGRDRGPRRTGSRSPTG